MFFPSLIKFCFFFSFYFQCIDLLKVMFYLETFTVQLSPLEMYRFYIYVVQVRKIGALDPQNMFISFVLNSYLKANWGRTEKHMCNHMYSETQTLVNKKNKNCLFFTNVFLHISVECQLLLQLRMTFVINVWTCFQRECCVLGVILVEMS